MKPPLEGEGEVFLYLEPFPQEADRLRFSIEGISAVKDDDTAFPLSMSLHEFKSRDMKRQRLIASGKLPPGNYTGLSFKVKNASLKVEDGEAALLVPQEAVQIDFSFSVKKKKSYVISLTFNYSKSIRERFSFSPVFSISIPEKPLASLLGYVACYDSNNIIVFDKRAIRVVGVIATGEGPRGIALAQELRRAYVTLSGDDIIEVIDTAAGEVIHRIRLNTGDKPQEPALTPDGTLLLTANTGSNTVSVIDTKSLIELSRINVGDGPNSILIDPAGRRAYAFNILSSTITVIDIANKSVAATISTEPAPLRGQFNRKGDKLYIIHEWSSYMAVIDPLSLSALDKISVGMGMSSIKVDTNTDMFYVGRKHDTIVKVYNPFLLEPVDYLEAGEGPTYMTIDGEENNLYLVIPETKTLMLINIPSKKVVSEIDVCEGPYWVTLMGER